jgi:hypothetical protein
MTTDAHEKLLAAVSVLIEECETPPVRCAEWHLGEPSKWCEPCLIRAVIGELTSLRSDYEKSQEKIQELLRDGVPGREAHQQAPASTAGE